MRSPSSIEERAAIPFSWISSSPLYREKRIEKEVRVMFSGTAFETRANAWLSVTTSFGQTPCAKKWSRVLFNSVSRTTRERAPRSRISRIVCCCGRIRRPFGAALSIGTTRMTRSRGLIRSWISGYLCVSSGFREAIFSFSSWMFMPSEALTRTSSARTDMARSLIFSVESRSILLYTIR